LLIKMLGILPIDNREQSEKRAAAKLQARWQWIDSWQG
jgi:hypothetical protein